MVLFFTNFLLGEKSELAKVWLAAHWEKKIKKSHIYEINVEHSVQNILSDEIVLDLRISGHLLVGIVRIHSRKVKYLLSECNDIFCQVRSFRCPVIDLPENKREAPVKDITLPELCEDFSSDFGKLDELLSLHQCRIEEITLKETHNNLLVLDDDYNFDFKFGDEDQPISFEDLECFSHLDDDPNPKLADNHNNLIHSSNVEKGENACGNENNLINVDALASGYNMEVDFADNDETMKSVSVEANGNSDNEINRNHSENEQHSDGLALIIDTKESPLLSLQVEEPKLILQSLQAPINKSQVEQKKKFKRKLTVDQVKILPYEKFLQQVYDTSDITTTLQLGPPSKKLMKLKAIGGAEQLFRLPAQKMGNAKINYLFQRHIKTQKNDEKSYSSEEGEDFCYESIEQQRLTQNKKVPTEIINGIRKSSMSYNVPLNFNSRIRKSSLSCNVPLNVNYLSDDTDYADDVERPVNTECFHSSNDSHFAVEATETQDKLNDFLDDFQSNTPTSEVEDDKWQLILQNRMVNTLKELYMMFETSPKLYFSQLVQHKKKIVVAQKFQTILMLKKFDIIELQQLTAYNEIIITKGRIFITIYDKYCE